MCSNTGNTACGCGTGGNGGGSSIWSSGVKKQQKRPRVPKRGPGVAELEKILREQQDNIDIPERGNNGNGVEGFSFPTHHSNPFHHSSLKSHHHPPHPPSPPPPHRMAIPSPSGPKSDHLVQTKPPSMMTSVYGYNNTPLVRNNGGSSMVLPLPEQELFPMSLNSCKSKSNLNETLDGSQSDSGNSSSRNLSGESNPIWSRPTATIQKRNNQYPPPPMMNQFLGAGNPASSGSLPIGLHNHVEPPSNQSSYYNSTSKTSEEHKMAGMKRSHPPTLGNSMMPPNFQVPPIFSNFNRPQHQSSMNENHGASSFTSANDQCYKDAKWGSTLELNSKRFNSEIGVHGHANFPPFATPPMHLFQGVTSKGNVLPYHVTEDRNEDSNKRSESSGSDQKPFYNFLEVNDPELGKDASGQNHGRREAGSRGIDLSLKL